FEEMKVGEVADKVFEVSGDYVVARLAKRDEADMQKFQTEKDRFSAQLAQMKGAVAVDELLATQCNRAYKAGLISFDLGLVEYSDSESAKGPRPEYVPCATLR